MQHRSIVLPNIGIDVGVFATKFTTGGVSVPSSLSTTIETHSFPSIPVHTDSPYQWACTSRLDGVTITVGPISYFVGKSAANLIGPEGFIRGGSDEYCKTEGYTALFKGALWHIARHHQVTGSLVIEHLVVGLPLSTINSFDLHVEGLCGRTHELPAPHDASQKITVEIKQVVVVAQPLGAVVNFIESQTKAIVQPDHHALVLDMGGGTFNWFVCTGDFEPSYKLCGATNIGTLNCTSAICRKIKPAFGASPIALERVDKALRTDAESFVIGGESYKTSEYWPLAVAKISYSLEQMRAIVRELDRIEHVILSGGGAPLLLRALRELAPDLTSRLKMDPDPVFGNVKGFHRLSEGLTE